MNSELIALTFKGLRRRWREVARVIAVVMISFMFVTGVLLYSGNMKKWQTAINNSILVTGLLCFIIAPIRVKMM